MALLLVFYHGKNTPGINDFIEVTPQYLIGINDFIEVTPQYLISYHHHHKGV